MKSDSTLTLRGQQIRQHMHMHVEKRLKTAIERYRDRTDTLARNEISRAQEKYRLDAILTAGAKAAEAVAIVSHLAKATHPDLKVKDVTHLAVNFSTLPALEEFGSHTLPADQSLLDATGDGAYNNAAYELYLLLDSSFEGQSLASFLNMGDEDVIRAFAFGVSIDELPWTDLLRNKCSQPAANSLSKQTYWLSTPDKACINEAYVLLVPLFAASLAHQVYLMIHADRFGEFNREARKAKYEHKAHEAVFHDYPGLAVQNMGGTQPQNISQLNSERRGTNYLHSSLPPSWQTGATRLPVRATSVFDRLFITRPEVRHTVRALQQFLESDPEPNLATRQRRAALLDTLLDELVSMAAELHQLLPPGWSRDDERFEKLDDNQKLWLDPLRAEMPEEADFASRWLLMDWPAKIGEAFANWLSDQLRGRLPVGDAEAREWKKVLLTDEDGFKQQLRELRDKLDAPHYIPIRKTGEELVALRKENL